MISFDGVGFERGEQVLFSDATLTIHPGQRVGLVGRNGAGKSTLFGLLRGRLEPLTGSLKVPPGWRIRHLAQEVDASSRTALDFVLDGDEALRSLEQALADAEAKNDTTAAAHLHGALADHAAYSAPARAGMLLHGLGFRSDDFDRPQQSFSGGWRIRLSLAQALLRPAELLLLDEPTNHLDLEATIWLEEHLRHYAGTLLIIAHDRDFLDSITTHTLHLSGKRLNLYNGNYSAFEQQRAAKLAQNAALFAKQQRDIGHMENFVRRFRAKATKAKQAQSRLKALERMERVVLLQQDSPYHVTFPNAEQFSSPLLSLDTLSLGYDQKTILKAVKGNVLPGDRIGVLGENGAGKSTLLKALVGELTPQAGEIVRGRHARIGYFAQHQLETLERRDSALISCRTRFGLTEQQTRDYLGGWGFSKTLIERPIEQLSGGEKARLVLALIAREKPGVLVLDEPTNHLDLDMREALAIALQSYEGALLLVSHDRALLERCVDSFWLVADGTVTTERVILSDYASGVRRYRNNADPGPAGQPGQKGTASSGRTDKSKPSSAAERRRAAAQQRRAVKPLKDQQRSLEKKVNTLTEELKQVEQRLADPDVYHSLPAAQLDQLLEQAGKLRKKLDDTEQAWLDLTEELEQLHE